MGTTRHLSMKKKLIALSLLMTANLCIASNLVITNVKGVTFDKHRNLQQFKSLYIKNGRVVQISSTSLAAKYPDAKHIDLQGKHILPGLIDAHGHVMGLGYTLLNLDVRDINSAQATAKQIKAFAAKHPHMAWIRGRGWNQVLWPGKEFPSAGVIDKYLADRPVWLRRVDGHAGWANSRALALAGIDKNTQAPAGGEIVRDKMGNPTGVLIDNAMALLEDKIPAYTRAEMEQALKKATYHLLKLGITSVHDAGIDFSTYQLYRRYAQQNKLPLRLYAMLSGDDKNLNRMLSNGYVNDANDFLSIRSVKLYADGALGSRGAALLKPYSDQPNNTGLLLTQTDALRHLYKKILSHQFQINIHGIGDRGVRIALDEFEKAFATVGGKKLRHRIEHAQVVTLRDIPRFKTLQIIPSMQPTHATSDMNMAGDRLGAARLKGAYAWRKFLIQGSPIAAGSDFPVELANPFFGLHAAVTRQDRQNKPPGGWLPEQAMSVEEALRAFTLDAAFAAHQENILGGLTPGKWADFIVIDRDIFSIPATSLWQTKVLATWIAGKSVADLK